jgi:hypothetical protein
MKTMKTIIPMLTPRVKNGAMDPLPANKALRKFMSSKSVPRIRPKTRGETGNPRLFITMPRTPKKNARYMYSIFVAAA